MNRSCLKVVAVSDDALRPELLDALLDDRNPYDVIFVESLTRAYSRIKQLVPDLIIVLMRVDDEPTCRLLTMLAVDRELYGIPVVTLPIGESEDETDHIVDRPVSIDSWAVVHA